MGLDREEVLASPLARLCYRESRFPRFSNPSRSVLRRSSLGSHLERSSVAYYFANFRAWTCDLTRTLDLELMLLRNSIAQKDRLRADLLRHAKNILDTLDDDLYLLYQARYHLDDLIKRFSESRPRDQTSPSA